MSITIQEIAKELNLSRNTVSKVINGKSVSNKTREIVIQKMHEMNYKTLNLNHTKKYRILLVSAKPLNNMHYFISLISSIENYCYENQYDLFQYTFNSKKNTFSKFSNYVKELNIDGIVVIESFDKDFINNLLTLNIPVCFHDFTYSFNAFNQNHDVICTNDEQSIINIVKKIHSDYKLTRFCFIGDNKHCYSFRKRYTGMLLGLMNLKIQHSNHQDILYSEEKFDYSNPKALKNELYKFEELPEVFICCNDFVARNVCSALKLMNKIVGQDALVVGFDNAAESYSLEPNITTFSIDKQYLGLEIIRALINRIEMPNIPSRVTYISTTPIYRESTILNK